MAACGSQESEAPPLLRAEQPEAGPFWALVQRLPQPSPDEGARGALVAACVDAAAVADEPRRMSHNMHGGKAVGTGASPRVFKRQAAPLGSTIEDVVVKRAGACGGGFHSGAHAGASLLERALSQRPGSAR